MEKQFKLERRRSPRARRVISIQFHLVSSSTKGGDRNWHLSTTNDMSASGLSFVSEVPYAVDDILEVNVVMSGVLDIFKGYGKVVRIEKMADGMLYLIAVKFVNRDDQKDPNAQSTQQKIRSFASLFEKF
jgi:hypothetical protein